jgi:hypothetical protein
MQVAATKQDDEERCNILFWPERQRDDWYPIVMHGCHMRRIPPGLSLGRRQPRAASRVAGPASAPIAAYPPLSQEPFGVALVNGQWAEFETNTPPYTWKDVRDVAPVCRYQLLADIA